MSLQVHRERASSRAMWRGPAERRSAMEDEEEEEGEQGCGRTPAQRRIAASGADVVTCRISYRCDSAKAFRHSSPAALRQARPRPQLSSDAVRIVSLPSRAPRSSSSRLNVISLGVLFASHLALP